MISNTLKITLFILSLFLFGCSVTQLDNKKENITILDEVDFTEIPLAGEVSGRKAEISGLCWYNNKLILLPQFPGRFSDSDSDYGKIYYIKKNKILNYLSGKDTLAILPDFFTINTNEFPNLFSKGSGFEAITTHNNTAYFSIESISNGKTVSYLINGTIDSVSKTITLKKETLVKVPNKLSINNIGNEAILFWENKIIPIYEANGENINPTPEIAIYDTNNNFIKTIPFPNIEYRITDVTGVDNTNTFWAINYFYPGEAKKLKPASDKLAEKFGIGQTNLTSNYIERLVQFEIYDNKIKLADTFPIYIKLPETEGRNWEGIVKLDSKGFLIATDMYPKTILAFVKI